VILRGTDDRLVNYEDTEETNRQRGELRAYNSVLATHHIDLPGLDVPQLVTGQDRGGIRCSTLALTTSSYAGSTAGVTGVVTVASMASEYLGTILIDYSPTLEVDYKALHIQILSAEQGVAKTAYLHQYPVNVLRV
jgi:hypothetical protein